MLNSRSGTKYPGTLVAASIPVILRQGDAGQRVLIDRNTQIPTLLLQPIV
jgi:hypothetical protein